MPRPTPAPRRRPPRPSLWARLRRWALIATSGAILLTLVINLAVFATTTGDMAEADALASADADYIVVLGAGIEADGSPNPILVERLDTAIALYDNGAARRIIVSGGEDAAQSEVSAMRNYLLAAGVPARAITADTHGIDTFASVRNLAEDYDAERVILVSQRFHLYRAIYIAEHLGLEATGCPAAKKGISDSDLLMREYFARIKDVAQCTFGPWNTASVGVLLYR